MRTYATRICSDCKSEYNTRGHYCPSCVRRRRTNAQRERYHADPNQAAAKRARVQRIRVQNRRRVAEYLRSHPCVDCGESDPIVLEFDHRDGVVKKAKVSLLLNSNGWATIKAEIEKCDVRCANCHRRRTARQFGWSYG